MAIPPFEEPSGLLPPGDHEATLAEIRDRFCWNYRRREIYRGLEYVTNELVSHQVDKIWVDGSFVTKKERPGDVDVAYEVPDGADPNDWGWLSPPRRRDLKKVHRVDLLPDWPNQLQMNRWFCRDEDGNEKGIIRLITDAA
jgi:Family of unknown function (DUF6932)